MDFLEDAGRNLTGFGQTLGDPAEDAFKSITGQTAQDEAAAGALRAEEAGQRAITVSDEAQRRLEEMLAPFAQFGTNLIPQAQNLFGPNAAQSVLNDPVLQSLQNQAEQRILAGQSARGRVNTGETEPILQDAFLRTGADLLSRQRGDLLNAIGLGQSSSAQTGVSGVDNAGRTGDLLTQIANSQTSAGLSGQRARTAGVENLISLGGTLFGKPG
jgi:hypothetical protein